MKIEGACHPVISVCPFNSKIPKRSPRGGYISQSISIVLKMTMNRNLTGGWLFVYVQIQLFSNRHLRIHAVNFRLYLISKCCEVYWVLIYKTENMLTIGVLTWCDTTHAIMATVKYLNHDFFLVACILLLTIDGRFTCLRCIIQLQV